MILELLHEAIYRASLSALSQSKDVKHQKSVEMVSVFGVFRYQQWDVRNDWYVSHSSYPGIYSFMCVKVLTASSEHGLHQRS